MTNQAPAVPAVNVPRLIGAPPETPRPHTFEFPSGSVTVVVGGNGAGKSALAAHIFRNQSAGTWITANRTLRFEPGGSSLSISQRTQSEQNHRAQLVQPGARTSNRGNTAEQIVLLDLVSRTHDARNTELEARRSGAQQPELAKLPKPPLELLNEILGAIGLTFQLVITNGALRCEPVGGGDSYDVSHLSDGERNAVVLSSSVLTAEPGIVIIDEPERHLNRALSAPLLNEIAIRRPDTHLVLLTHDLDFAAALPPETTTTVVLRAVVWSGEVASGWDFDVLEAGRSVDEHVRRVILGGRKRVILCEGDELSLDARLYRRLVPGVDVLPVGSCSDVIRSVFSHEHLTDLHWTTLAGIVDRDHRTTENLQRLEERMVFENGHYSVEGLLCHSAIRDAVSEYQEQSQSASAGAMKEAARTAGLEAFDDELLRVIAAHRSASIVDRELKEAIPAADNLAASGDPLEVSVRNPFVAELAALQAVRSSDDLEALIRLAPMKRTVVPAKIAGAFGLGLQSYYRLAISLVGRDKILRAQVRAQLSLPADDES